MKANHFKDNLMNQLKRSKKRPIDLSRDLHISQATVYSWTKGTSIPRYDSIKLLSDYFHCDISELTENPADVREKITGKMIPVLGVVAGGFPIYAEV